MNKKELYLLRFGALQTMGMAVPTRVLWKLRKTEGFGE